MSRYLKEVKELDLQLSEGTASQAEGIAIQKPCSGGILQGVQHSWSEVNNGEIIGDKIRERMVLKLHRTL